MTPRHLPGHWLRRHPLALAVAASLVLHGVALAAGHYLWRGTAPAPIHARTIAMVMIEQAPPTPDPQPPASEPTPISHPAARAAAHTTPPPAPAKPPAREPAVESTDTARPIALTPPRRPPFPARPVALLLPIAASPDTAFPPETVIIQSMPTSEVVPSAVPPEPNATAAGTNVATNRIPEAPSPPRYGVNGVANPRPRYPWLSRQRGEQGRVILRVIVDAVGRATDVAVLATSGHGRLDRAAASAVRRWQFAPAQRAGHAVAGSVDVPVTFRLADD